jgi:hypothetical protein
MAEVSEPMESAPWRLLKSGQAVRCDEVGCGHWATWYRSVRFRGQNAPVFECFCDQHRPATITAEEQAGA